MASAGRPELNHAGPRTGCDIDNVRPAAIACSDGGRGRTVPQMRYADGRIGRK
jgi:hypothetical protein